MQETQPHRRPRAPQARPVRREDPTRGPRRSKWRRRLLVTLFLILAACLVVTIVVLQRAAAFNDAVSTAPAFSMRLFGPFAPERVNVLLLGYSDESREGAYLSDSMNLVSIDRDSDKTTMIPIPRDLWIEGLPQVPQNMKINEALRIGYYAGGIENGAELAAEAVTYATGLPIHGWMALDFQGFQAMVDEIGGITIENPTAFEYTWDEDSWRAGQFSGSFEAGALELDGREALDYARNRYTSVAEESSDFARLVRQQRVLQAIRSEVSGWQALSKGLGLADSLQGHLHTNLPVADLGLLMGKLDVDHRLELAEDVILRASTNSVGQYVLVVIGQASATDYQPLHEYIRAELAKQPPLPSTEPG